MTHRGNNSSHADENPTSSHRNLSVGAAAQHLNVSESFLNKLRVTGKGPIFAKLGSRCIYRILDLDEWLAARRRTSTADTGSEAA